MGGKQPAQYSNTITIKWVAVRYKVKIQQGAAVGQQSRNHRTYAQTVGVTREQALHTQEQYVVKVNAQRGYEACAVNNNGGQQYNSVWRQCVSNAKGVVWQRAPPPRR